MRTKMCFHKRMSTMSSWVLKNSSEVLQRFQTVQRSLEKGSVLAWLFFISLVLSTYHIRRVHFTKLPRKKLVPLGRQIKELLEQKQYETIHFISVIIIENVKNGWTWGSGRKTIVPWLEMIICLVQVLYYIGLLVALFQLWHCLGQQFSLEFKLVCRPGKITSFTLTKLLRKYVPGVEDR